MRNVEGYFYKYSALNLLNEWKYCNIIVNLLGSNKLTF